MDLNKHILYINNGIVKLVDKLSNYLDNGSCLYKKMSKKVFILRNYVNIISRYKLLPVGMQFAGGLSFTDIDLDESGYVSMIINIDVDGSVFSKEYVENTTANEIALDIEDFYSSRYSVVTLVIGGSIYLYTTNTEEIYLEISVPGEEDAVYDFEYINSEDSISIFREKANCITEGELCNIIDSSYKLLETQCNCK